MDCLLIDRSISLLPIVSKIFKKLILNKLQRFLIENNIISDHQFGFREHHSTTRQVHRVAKYIRANQEEKKHCSATFLDVSQASKYGIQGFYIK